MKKTTLSLIIFVAIVALAGWIWQNSQVPITPIIEEKVNVNISFVFDEDNTINIPYERSGHPDVEEAYNLFKISAEIAQQQNWIFESQDYGELGILITQIDNKANGDDNSYWQYFVDGEQPQISANNYYPQLNEQIEWKFQESEY